MEGLDLSSLHCLFSGGEAVVVDTAKAFLECLGTYGLPPDCIFPCFGMTETCAGCIVNAGFPEVIDEGHAFAPAGECCADLKARIVSDGGAEVEAGEAGELQLSGPMVFIGYHQNQEATQESFTEENGVRWFRTGDRGIMSKGGCLRLTGRSKETINILGNQYFNHEIEAAIGRVDGLQQAVAISVREGREDTEKVIIFFVLEQHAASSRAQLGAAVASECRRQFGIDCSEVVPVTAGDLPTGSLGKVSRSTMESRYLGQEYAPVIASYKAECEAARQQQVVQSPTSPEERQVVAIWSEVLQRPATEISTEDNLFVLGGTSVQTLAIKQRMEETFGIDMEVTQIYRFPTVVSLTAWVKRKRQGEVVPYDPIVPMQSTGKGTPLFFVHPGVGHVQVFTNIAKEFAGEALLRPHCARI